MSHYRIKGGPLIIKDQLDVGPVEPGEVFVDVPLELGEAEVEDALRVARLLGQV